MGSADADAAGSNDARRALKSVRENKMAEAEKIRLIR